MAITDSDPRYHTERIRGMLGNVLTHCRDDVNKVKEPKPKYFLKQRLKCYRAWSLPISIMRAKPSQPCGGN